MAKLYSLAEFRGDADFYSTVSYLNNSPSLPFIISHPLINLPSSMPCHLSEIFYISQFKDNKLLCSFSDENGDVHEIHIIYYFPTTVDRPFPQAYEVIQPGHVYFITGSMSFQNKDLIV